MYFKMKGVPMNYIVFDLEFNQNITVNANTDNEDSISQSDTVNIKNLPFEILQIGAVKLDSSLQTISSFDRFIKPTIYNEISPFVSELTGITTEQVINEEPFPSVYKDFMDFIDDPESIFCVWGIVDMKELYRSAKYYDLDTSNLPMKYINIQPYASLHFGLPAKKLLQLKHTIEGLTIPITYDFHNALHDAYYTGEIFKKIYNTTMVPKIYDPNYVKVKVRPPKKVIDFEALIKQFEKMYERELSKEEQDMIMLAYKMGKTNQFLK